MAAFILTLLMLLLLMTGILYFLSPGNPQPFLDASGNVLKGSVSEKVFITLNGVQQGMFIKSKDVSRPVLLFLHGGIPEYFLTRKYPTGLEDYFTVVWPEQRGSGLSFDAAVKPETITLEMLISDTKEITHYLRHRFGQQKIYLMGHSGGSFLGINVVARYPELYHAYFGVAQITNQLESEYIAYNYMLSHYREKGNRKMVSKMEKAPVSLTQGTSHEYLLIRDMAMHYLGIGTTREMKSIVTGVFFSSLMCRDYTIKEKFNLWYGKSRTGVSVMWDTIMQTNIGIAIPELKLPVYFFHGIYDYTVSYDLSKTYYEALRAPVKGFYTFDDSAHSPMLEEPDKMMQIISEILHLSPIQSVDLSPVQMHHTDTER